VVRNVEGVCLLGGSAPQAPRRARGEGGTPEARRVNAPGNRLKTWHFLIVFILKSCVEFTAPRPVQHLIVAPPDLLDLFRTDSELKPAFGIAAWEVLRSNYAVGFTIRTRQ
jgi:hypothetical protein